jgi:hypothetical protein
MEPVRPPRRNARDALGQGIDRLPLPLILVAPAVVLIGVAIAIPEPVRLGFTIDLEIYRRYAAALLVGLAPYRDVPVEYPPLALIPFVLPLIGAPSPTAVDLATYTWRFVAVAAALAVATGALVWWATASRRAVALWGLLVALSWVSAVFRYDLWPVVPTLTAVLLAQRRPGLAGLALGVGTMLKLFPAVLVPVVAAAALVRRDVPALARTVAAFGLVVAVVAGWAWLVAGAESLNWVRYQGERGLQLESLGASLLLALHVIAGLPIERNFDFGAVQVVAPGSAELAATAPWLQATVLAAAVALATRRFSLDRRRLGRIPAESLALASLAAIAAPLLVGKVLSMQYVLWLLPLVPLLRARLGAVAVVLAAMTTAVYTADYEGLWHFSPLAIGLLVARNLVLAAFVAMVARELWTGQAAPSDGPAALSDGPAALSDGPAAPLYASSVEPDASGPHPRSRRPER